MCVSQFYVDINSWCLIGNLNSMQLKLIKQAVRGFNKEEEKRMIILKSYLIQPCSEQHAWHWEKKNHKLEIKFHLIPCSKQLACIWYAGDKKKRSFESEAEGIDFW